MRHTDSIGFPLAGTQKTETAAAAAAITRFFLSTIITIITYYLSYNDTSDGALCARTAVIGFAARCHLITRGQGMRQFQARGQKRFFFFFKRERQVDTRSIRPNDEAGSIGFYRFRTAKFTDFVHKSKKPKKKKQRFFTITCFRCFFGKDAR